MTNPHVIVVGAGFGGLSCARALGGSAADVVLIDRHNYHLFTPLLYQVASSLLNPSDIAYPVRAVFRKAGNVHVRVGEVNGVDLERRAVLVAASGAPGPEEAVPFDYLVLASGSTTNFFGNASAAAAAHGLKDLPEALELRNHVLSCFERATREPDAATRAPWLTFAIVGAGPTGVEYAGALSELARLGLARDFPELDMRRVQIVLIEAHDRVLGRFPRALGEDAARRLARRGVTVRLNTRVERVAGDVITLAGRETLIARTLVWAAGVQPGDLAQRLELPKTKSGRIAVDEYLRVAGHERVFAIGDIAAVPYRGGEMPMLSAPAMQQGRHVARAILRAARGGAPEPFHYVDKGTMATIGRSAAVAEIGPLKLKGLLGWLAWLFVHLYYIIGFRNRLVVLVEWAWDYFRYDRPIRIIARAKEQSAER
jgi:NADH:quinone reductase (non-electrogenic)